MIVHRMMSVIKTRKTSKTTKLLTPITGRKSAVTTCTSSGHNASLLDATRKRERLFLSPKSVRKSASKGDIVLLLLVQFIQERQIGDLILETIVNLMSCKKFQPNWLHLLNTLTELNQSLSNLNVKLFQLAHQAHHLNHQRKSQFHQLLG